MQMALQAARRAGDRGEVPVGAVVVSDGKIVSEAGNAPIANCDPTAHAEVLALRQAGRVCQNYRLVGATVYVTLEPCAMCLGAMIHARVQRLVFGAFDPKGGAVTSVLAFADDARLNHRIQWQGGVLQDECAQLLRDFFRSRR